MRKGSLALAVLAIFVAMLISMPSSISKDKTWVTESIVIDAPPEYVFQAIRRQRDDARIGRKTLSFDGKVAKIDDHMEHVVIYGKVHSVWQETERPFEGVDYTMVSSDHFTSASGHWTLTPSADKKTTTLKLESLMDSGLKVPFADTITRMNLSKDSKDRLARLKKWAEEDYKNGVTPGTPPIKKE
jgi:Polyketide cyclase / dehydrase and lipid transport